MKMKEYESGFAQKSLWKISAWFEFIEKWCYNSSSYGIINFNIPRDINVDIIEAAIVMAILVILK